MGGGVSGRDPAQIGISYVASERARRGDRRVANDPGQSLARARAKSGRFPTSEAQESYGGSG